MSLRNILLFLAATHGRVASNDTTNDRDPEVGLKISPEDTIDRNIDHDEADNANEQTTEDPFDPNNSRRRRRFSSATAFSRTLTLVDTPTWFQTVKTFVFPPKENIDSFIPNYRHTPIVSGLLVPFSILLEIPAVTEHWYIRTENNQVIESRPNPKILDIGLGISLGCAVLANICLITRFLEQRVKTMTILCTIFLSIHGTPYSIFMGRIQELIDNTDIINIVAVTVFGVQHRFSDGFTYGQSFWMTVCSTAASTITNATLLWDLYRTPDFNKSGMNILFIIEQDDIFD
jgi:potassium channel subfamily K, other eukaryote